MIKANDIKQILAQVPAGEQLTVNEIQQLVRNNYQLTSEDWAIHTETRPTNYRKWLHRVQAVLSEYKKKGIIKHDPATCSYKF